MNIIASRSLYHRLGGEAAVEATVHRFNQRILSDPRIRHFFETVDMVDLYLHQKRFLSQAFGGPGGYQGRSMREAHRHLVERGHLSGPHFDAMVEHLAGTLRDLDVPEDLIQEAKDIANQFRHEVLNQ